MKRFIRIPFLAALLVILLPRALRCAQVEHSNPAPTLVLMCICAHPDDEDGGTLAYYAKIRGIRTYEIFFTCGEGGQNEIGSDLYEDLGALRTDETVEAAKILGSEPHFLGFPDFGFSKTAKETFARWGGKDSVLARLVYCIRALKPDVIISNHDTITTKPRRQHGNHQAAGITAFEAFEKAADPGFHPEQFSGEVGPWQPKKMFWRVLPADTAYLGTRQVVEIQVGARDSLGESMEELAVAALQKHRSQGLGRVSLASIPEVFRRRRFILVRSVKPYPFDARDLFSGINPEPRVQGVLPGAASGLRLFSISVSPEAVPLRRSDEFVVHATNRTSPPSSDWTLSVFGGGDRFFHKRFLNGTQNDTIRISFDSPGRDSVSVLRFSASATVSGDVITSEALVRRRPVRAKFSPAILIGLVKTYDDTHEETLRSLGVPYRLVDSTELRKGDLGRYTTILLDLRAYAYRPDAVSYNSRLLEYVKQGGNIVCCYHKTGDWNGKNFAPYPIRLTAERVTEEDAPVTILLPDHALLNAPNPVGAGDWGGWIQERSIYLPADDTLQTSARYDRILAMSDEDDHQPPTSLLSASYGAGSYTYLSLVLYRQLRSLQDGAVKLFLNLISQPRHRLPH